MEDGGGGGVAAADSVRGVRIREGTADGPAEIIGVAEAVNALSSLGGWSADAMLFEVYKILGGGRSSICVAAKNASSEFDCSSWVRNRLIRDFLISLSTFFSLPSSYSPATASSKANLVWATLNMSSFGWNQA